MRRDPVERDYSFLEEWYPAKHGHGGVSFRCWDCNFTRLVLVFGLLSGLFWGWLIWTPKT